MGIELELAVLLGLVLVGTEIFAPFEIETPADRDGDAHFLSYYCLLRWAGTAAIEQRERA